MLETKASKSNSRSKQYLYGVAMVLSVSMVCYMLQGYLEYRVTALILLATVSVAAMVFDILPVLLTALLSALVWDFFFIPPHFTLQISNTADGLTLLLYFVIAMVNAVLTYKIRQVEKDKRDKEQKANTVKLYDTILHSLSHELRTPIATIIGATDNILSNEANLSDEHRKELVGEISKASLRLNQQVENLLNQSRIESGILQPKKDWVDMNELAYDVVNKLEEAPQRHELRVIIQDNMPLFKLDYGLMEQVIYNLLNNALVHTPQGTVIKLTASNVNDTLQLTIEDNGPGITVTNAERLFDKFYRGNPNAAGGTGLGLSIAKGFVEAHGGTIRLTEATNGGATFVIEITAETSYLNNLKNE